MSASVTQRPVDMMSIRDVILELRETTNPETNKPHSLTDIARIAGASKGWTASVLEHGESKGNKRSESYGPNLRRYLRTLRGDRPVRSEADLFEGLGIRRRSKEEHEARQVVRLEAQMAAEKRDELPPLPKVERIPVAPMPTPRAHVAPAPAPAAPAVMEKSEVIAPNGARVVTKTPKEEPAKEPPKQTFMERFDGVKTRMWEFTTEIDALEADAPALFKPGIAQLRDDLMVILQKLEG